METLKIGFSPCPNDTFIFHAMTHGLVDTGGFSFETIIKDVDELNRMAFEGAADITKLSFHAYLKLRDRYDILSSGSALGFGCGPLLVNKSGHADKNAIIAVPGELTTASLLLRLYLPDTANPVFTRFDRIMPGIKSGEFDAGVIIHEGRFVYENYGLRKIVDLGSWWESLTGMPIPLGCIAVKKDLGAGTKNIIESVIRSSVLYAFNNRETSWDFIRRHASEMDEGVIRSHIDLYVNDFTIELGEKGMKAVNLLESMAREKGII